MQEQGIGVGNFRLVTPGYQEIMNCKEIIGYAVIESTGEQILTSCAKIQYAKDEVHIVSTLPFLEDSFKK